MSIPKLVRDFYDRIWNEGDLEAVSDLLTKDFLFRGSLGSERHGRKGFTDYVQSVRGALSNYHCEILECVTEGERAFAKMCFSGRHVAEFRGFYLSVANCYSAHDSLGFPVLLPFCDAQSDRSFHPLHRYPSPLARTGRGPFRSCRVASPQAPTPDRESLPATSA